MTAPCTSLCLLDTATEPRDMSGLHAVAGLRDSSICVLPYSLKSQWLQGAVWNAKLTVKCSDAPVTVLDFRHRLLYAGTALGKIHAFRPVSGAEDMGTLQKVANEMERLGYGRSAEEFAKTGLPDGRSAGSPLREVVRLDRAFVLDCHAAAVTSLCLAGGVFFSAGADMAVVSWAKPRDDRTAQFRAIPQAGQAPPKRLSQAYSHAKVVHKAPITAMDVAGDLLLTADADGNVCCTVAKRFREIVDTKATEAQDESFLEEEVLEKPKFFHQRELKELSARHFLAHLLAHYYPMRPLSHAAKGHAPEEEPVVEQESSDEEYLDDAFVAGGFVGEDEDGDTGRVPSGDELESDEESLESLSSEGSENSGEDGFIPLPSESEEESESELSSVSGSDSEEDSEAERVYEA